MLTCPKCDSVTQETYTLLLFVWQGGKGDKFRARKAREAAGKAASVAASTPAPAPAPAPTVVSVGGGSQPDTGSAETGSA
jgi:hypothetical protein